MYYTTSCFLLISLTLSSEEGQRTRWNFPDLSTFGPALSELSSLPSWWPQAQKNPSTSESAGTSSARPKSPQVVQIALTHPVLRRKFLEIGILPPNVDVPAGVFERVYKDHRCGGIFVSQHFVYGFQQCKELCWMETRCNFLEFDQTIHSDSNPDYVLGRKCSLYQSCDPKAVRMLHDVESPWLIFRKLSKSEIEAEELEAQKDMELVNQVRSASPEEPPQGSPPASQDSGFEDVTKIGTSISQNRISSNTISHVTLVLICFIFISFSHFAFKKNQTLSTDYIRFEAMP